MKRFFLLVLFFANAFCFSQTTKFLDLKINSPFNEIKSEKIFSVEWDENWFGEKSSFEYNHRLARAACFFANSAYSVLDEKSNGNDISYNFKKLGVSENAVEIHYNIDYSNSIWGNDQCAFSFGSKTISTSAGQRTLIFIIIRGTPLNANEWLSNLNIDDSNQTEKLVHKGFALASHLVHSALLTYIIRQKIDTKNVCLLITGHSRGGAISNLLAAQLLDDELFDPKNIYAYTFAAPNTTTSEESSSEKYGYIWNIVNAEDVVPTVPLNRGNWHFTKYGKILTLANYCNTDQNVFENDYLPKINDVFNNFNGRDYVPFKAGPFIPVIITSFLNRTVSDVEKFYNGGFSLYDTSSFLFNKIFPQKSPEEPEPATKTKKDKKEKRSFKEFLIEYLDEKTEGFVRNVPLAFNDMHTCDTYYSFMAALDEKDAFKNLGYSIVILKGFQETSVFTNDKKPLCKIIDGKLHLLQTKHPLMAVSSFGERTYIGMPANMEFDFFVSNESLFSTPTKINIENFDVAGIYIGETPVEKIYTRLGKALTFKAGKETLWRKSFDTKNVFVVGSAQRRELIKTAKLHPSRQFFFGQELFTGTIFENFDFGYGLRTGIPLIYGTFLFSRNLGQIDKDWNFFFGAGTRISIYKSLMLDIEFLPKFTVGIDQFNFSTMLRPAASLKIFGNTRLALGATIEYSPKSSDVTPGIFMGLRQ